MESLVVSCAAWWPPPSVPSPARRLDSTPAARTQLLYPSPCRFPNSPSALYSPVPHPPFHLSLLSVLPRPAPVSFLSCLILLLLNSSLSHFSFFPPSPSNTSTRSPPCLLPCLHLKLWVLCLSSELCVLPFIPCPDMTPLCSLIPLGLSAFIALS